MRLPAADPQRPRPPAEVPWVAGHDLCAEADFLGNPRVPAGCREQAASFVFYRVVERPLHGLSRVVDYRN